MFRYHGDQCHEGWAGFEKNQDLGHSFQDSLLDIGHIV